MNNWNLISSFSQGKILRLIGVILLFPYFVTAQQNGTDSVIDQATLTNCIHYAINHNPNIKNAILDEAITETTIKSKLSEWYPQINFNYNLQHNFELPAANFNGNIVHIGSQNTSG